MTAVLKHELRNYFHSFTAYVFGAFLLAIVGFGSMLYNLSLIHISAEAESAPSAASSSEVPAEVVPVLAEAESVSVPAASQLSTRMIWWVPSSS